MTQYVMNGKHALLLLLVALLTLSACGTAPAAPPAADEAAPASEPATGESGDTAAPETATIRIGYLPVTIQAPLFVGIERGYFADEGIEFELDVIASGNDAVVQLAAGNFDIAMGGANAGLFNAAERGLEFTIIAPMHGETPPNATPLIISANRTDEITEVADLRGKTVAVHAFGTAIEYWMAEALAQGGLTMDDVNLVAVPFPNMAPALDSGEIDAAVLTEPLVAIGEQQELVAVLSDDFIENFIVSFVYANNEWLTNNPDVAERFMRAYMRAMRDLQGDYTQDAEIAAAIEKYTEVPAAVVAQSTPAIFPADGVIPVTDLETLQTFYAERGLLEFDEPIDISAYVNQEMATTAVEQIEADSSEVSSD